jgi:predicted nuclease of predicted toxin-antitoxin system
LGHDVVTVSDTGKAGQGVPDEEILALAHAQNRALLTHNRKDFRNLHKAGNPHSGLILCTEDADFEALAARIHRALSSTTESAGGVIRVNRPPG